MLLFMLPKYPVATLTLMMRAWMKLAYLSSILGKLNKLNQQLQGKDEYLPHLTDKITCFTKKIEMWENDTWPWEN